MICCDVAWVGRVEIEQLLPFLSFFLFFSCVHCIESSHHVECYLVSIVCVYAFDFSSSSIYITSDSGERYVLFV